MADENKPAEQVKDQAAPNDPKPQDQSTVSVDTEDNTKDAKSSEQSSTATATKENSKNPKAGEAEAQDSEDTGEEVEVGKPIEDNKFTK